MSGIVHTPINGQLIGVKDNICTSDLPTTCASNILRDYVSPFDATVVGKIRAAGGIIAGKTNLDEFGMGSHSVNSAFGRVVNQWSLTQYSAGGSSGGSAAAVSAGLCVAAVGTDTGGSVRLPAAFCGIVGFKPSYGMLSRYGVVAYANSLDTVGVLGKTVPDVQGLWTVMRGSDPRDPTCLTEERREVIEGIVKSQDLHLKQSLRIGIPFEYRAKMEEPVRSAWQACIERLMQDGHKIVPVRLPRTAQALPAYYILAPAEASSNLAKYDGVRYGRPSDSARLPDDVLYARTRFDGLGDEVRRRILLGSYSLSSTAIDNYFIQAQKIRRLVQQDFDNVFRMPHPLRQASRGRRSHKPGNVDLLLTPTVPTRAPRLDAIEGMDAVARYESDLFTVPASLAGLPAISLPVARTSNTLPVGMQFIGQYGNDDFVLDFARSIERKLADIRLQVPRNLKEGDQAWTPQLVD